MPSTTVAVGSSVGLHARPAALIAEAAAAFEAEITLSTPGGEPVDAGSALFVMTLGAAHGDPVTVTSDDAEAVARISALVASDLDA